MTTPDLLAQYRDWCAQNADGEMPPLSFEEWQRERGCPHRRRAAELIGGWAADLAARSEGG